MRVRQAQCVPTVLCIEFTSVPQLLILVPLQCSVSHYRVEAEMYESKVFDGARGGHCKIRARRHWSEMKRRIGAFWCCRFGSRTEPYVPVICQSCTRLFGSRINGLLVAHRNCRFRNHLRFVVPGCGCIVVVGMFPALSFRQNGRFDSPPRCHSTRLMSVSHASIQNRQKARRAPEHLEGEIAMSHALHRNRLGRRSSAGLPEFDTLFNQFFRSEGGDHVARAGFDLGGREHVPRRGRRAWRDEGRRRDYVR